MEEKSNSRLQWDKLKDQPFSEKLRYILGYYGIWIGVAAFIVFLGIFAIFLGGEKGNKRLAYGIIFNHDVSDSRGEINSAVCQWLDKKPEDYEIEFYPYLFEDEDPVKIYDEQEAIFARILAGDLDFMVGNPSSLLAYIDENDEDYCNLCMLDEILPEDLLKELEDRGRLVRTDTAFKGKVCFLVNIADSYISRGLDVSAGDLCLAFVVNGKHQDALIAMCQLLIE